MLVRSREEMFEDTRQKRKSYMRAVFRVFPKQACQYTVKDVIWWMEELNCGHDTVTIPAVGDTPQRMWQLKSSPIIHAKAQDVPGEWYGGPRVIKKYKGHLMQLLMDRILTEINSHGTAHFLAVSKLFKRIKKSVTGSPDLKDVTIQPCGATSATTDISSSIFDRLDKREKFYNIKYADIMGTSEWGGKCPFNIP